LLGQRLKGIAVTFQVPRQIIALALWLAALCTAAGCTGVSDYFRNGLRVGPEYRKPSALIADDWIDSSDPRLEAGPADCRQWWSVFQDPALDRLVALAYEQNISLREAGFRVVEAREQRAVVAGNLFPQTQELFGDFTQTQRSTKTATFRRSSSQIESGNVGLRVLSNWRLGTGLAWELDFWGRFRRAMEAADARLNSSVENYDDALVLLIAEVATAYVDYRTVDQRLTFARGDAEMQQESTRIAEARLTVVAIDSEIDAPQAKSNLARTLAAIEALEIARRQSENRLCVLLGMPPQDLGNLLEGTKPVPVAPQSVAVGIPAELLRRRPDVRRAERLAAALNAEIGVAQANLYPRIALNGSMAFESAQFGDLFDAGAWSGTVGPSFRWNVLNYGRLLHGVRVQDARFQQQAAAYVQTVLRANEEVENAIVAFLHYHDQIGLLEQSVHEAQEAVRVAQAKYRAGRIDFNRVFTVEQLLITQQDQLATAQGNLANSLIQIYRSLGGGWEIRFEPVSIEPAA
jgi:NodT family efflux transporter outer membrane factor (OMF) lipoprotein